MAELRMLIGLPGCGKSTYAENSGLIVHSSDAIRAELSLGETEGAKTFDTLNKRVIADLRADKAVIFDATNLSRKDRMNTLKMLNNAVRTPFKKVAVLFVVPVEVCMERNRNRTRVVPDYVYNRMLRRFDVPLLTEGWDEIEVVFSGFDAPFTKLSPDDLLDFNQENHHHSLTLGEHINKAVELIKTSDEDAIEAMRYHDIGKFYTKRFENTRGEKTEEAHYYGHANYGAYLYLVYNHDMKLNRLMKIAALINWHMAPYERWTNHTRLERDKDLLSDAFIETVNIMHEADAEAH